ncbi:MAG: sugar ABC transporter permease [Clostridia bacterium]|nr:sugar ABC transporter permease [Clostridia bacterium]
MNFNLEQGVPIRKQLNRFKWYYLMILPILVWYIMFSYVPMFGISIAFFDYNAYQGFAGSQWYGFHWFEYLLDDQLLRIAFVNSLIINLQCLIFSFPMPIILALLLNECRAIKFKRTVQTISYLPHFISWAIVGGLVYSLLSPSSGFVNTVIKALGGEPIYFMGDSRYTRSIIVISGIWKGIGWGSILYLAALTGINQELYEAATLDGANKLQQVWHITLPGISHIISMQLIFYFTGFFDVGFEQTFNLVNPVTYDTGLVISLLVYNKGLKQAQFEFATAVGLLQSIMGMIMLVTANGITRKISEDNSLF